MGAFFGLNYSAFRCKGRVKETNGVADLGIETEDLQKLGQLVERYRLSELRYEDGDLRVTLRTADFMRPSAATILPGIVAAPAGAVPTGTDEPVETADNDQMVPADGASGGGNQIKIEAPVMGVFYRSPAPGESAFVEIGDVIEPGQIVGMIEAMKVFSEVPTEIAGRIVAIPAKNGGLVQPGDALVVVEGAA